MTPPEPPPRLRALPSRMLAMTALHSDRLISEGLAALDARKWHYAVLVALHDLGPASQAALSDRTGIYRSDLVAVLNELAEQGYVDRTPDPQDRRRNVVALTADGRRRLRRLEAVIAALQDDLLAPLSEAEREQFVRTLSRLLEHHDQTRSAM